MLTLSDLLIMCTVFLYTKVAATVRATREELTTVPSDIAKMVGAYMASHDWGEAG
jgi:hypothetical protein